MNARRVQPSRAVCEAFAANSGWEASWSDLHEFRLLEPSESESAAQGWGFSAQSVQEGELMNRQQKEKCYFFALKHVCLVDNEEQ